MPKDLRAAEGADGAEEDFGPPTARDPLTQRSAVALATKIASELRVDLAAPLRVPPCAGLTLIEPLEIAIGEVVASTRVGEVERSTRVADEWCRTEVGRPVERRRRGIVRGGCERDKRSGEHQMLEVVDVGTGDRAGHESGDRNDQGDERTHGPPSGHDAGIGGSVGNGLRTGAMQPLPIPLRTAFDS